MGLRLFVFIDFAAAFAFKSAFKSVSGKDVFNYVIGNLNKENLTAFHRT